MASVQLSLRDRVALAARAVAGTLPTDPKTVGGRLLAGVIQSGGQPPARGVREVLDGYNHQPWLRAVVSRISYDTASTDWLLYVKRRSKGELVDGGKAVLDAQVKAIQRATYGGAPRADGTDRKSLIKAAVEAGDLEPVTEHQYLDLLDSFNPYHTGLAARRVTQQHLDLVGEAFWLIEPDARGMPVALWPIPPSWILGTPTVSRPFFRVSFRGWQGPIPASEIVWFCELDPLNPYGRGTGTAQALGDDLETDEYASKHVKAYFFNRARPDLIVSPKSDDGSGMEEGEVSRLEEGWGRRSQGFWRAFKPFFVRRPIDIKELDQNLRSQQFVQLREFERNTCIQVFGVSPEILGIIAGGSNRATINTAEYIYGKRVLVPRLEIQRTVQQERLIPRFDERLILDYVNPVGRDAELEMEAARAMPAALSIDEWRSRMGEPSLANGAGAIHLSSPLLQPTDFSIQEPEPDLPLNEPPRPGELPPGDEEAAWDRYLRP